MGRHPAAQGRGAQPGRQRGAGGAAHHKHPMAQQIAYEQGLYGVGHPVLRQCFSHRVATATVPGESGIENVGAQRLRHHLGQRRGLQSAGAKTMQVHHRPRSALPVGTLPNDALVGAGAQVGESRLASPQPAIQLSQINRWRCARGWRCGPDP